MQIHNQARFQPHAPYDDDERLVSSPAPSNFRVLIVNEDMRNADSLKRTLNDLGYFATRTAYSAGRALSVAKDFAPSVALVDLVLPDMTGYQLAKRLRSHLCIGVRKVPLLAIAEYPLYGTAELTRAAGFMGWRPKPVEPLALNLLLSRLQTGS